MKSDNYLKKNESLSKSELISLSFENFQNETFSEFCYNIDKINTCSDALLSEENYSELNFTPQTKESDNLNEKSKSYLYYFESY